jgi:hypothetical protein
VGGKADLLAHNTTAAASEFQKMLEGKGIVVDFVTGSLAHLQIGCAFTMGGVTRSNRKWRTRTSSSRERAPTTTSPS